MPRSSARSSATTRGSGSPGSSSPRPEKLLTVVAAVFGVVMAMAFLAAAVVVFLFVGVAGWLGEATGKPWLGSLITGAAAIALIAIAFLIGRNRLEGR